MLTVLWISRHQMTYDQQVDLQQILDETCKLVQYDKTVISLSQILPQLRQADVICAVLPPELCSQILEAVPGKPLLRAISGRVPTGRTVTAWDGRKEQEYAFVHRGWEQIIRMDIKTRRLSRLASS